MKISSLKLDPSLSLNERALIFCQRALELKDQGNHVGVMQVMRPIWDRVGDKPKTKGLHPSVTAEVKLCVGILTGWIGSKNEIKDAQEIAKNLITESITYFDSVGDTKKVAAARVEIAYCYWREGELNEARILLREALEKLTSEGTTRAKALLKLTTIELSASHYDTALEVLSENAQLFKKINSYATKGAYHNQLAIVLRNLAIGEKRERSFIKLSLNTNKLITTLSWRRTRCLDLTLRTT